MRDEQRWTICLQCGQNVTTGMCVCVVDSEFVVVVPASVLDEARSRVRELEDALRTVFAVIDGDEEDMSDCPYHRGTGICRSGCTEEPACQTDEPTEGWPLVRARGVLASSSAPGYANHVGAPGGLGEGPHNSAPTDATCPDCRDTGYCDRDACHTASKDQP